MCSKEHCVLEHIESLSTKYGWLYRETHSKLPLNIDAIDSLVFFSVSSFFLLSQRRKVIGSNINVSESR